MGRTRPIGICDPCAISVRGPYNVGRTVQTDPTLLRYASAITEQKKCWELLAVTFDRFQTLRNNTEQHPTTCNRVCKQTQHVTSNNIASVCTGLQSSILLWLQVWSLFFFIIWWSLPNVRGTQRQFSENICAEDDLRSRIFGTFVLKFAAGLPLVGFWNI